MRNVDKIKALEKELGRYKKKVADQAKENTELRRRLREAYAGNAELRRAVDAVLVHTALTYGQEAVDEETGVPLGHRLPLPFFQIEDILGRYEVRTRRDENTMEYIIGVVSREEAEV